MLHSCGSVAAYMPMFIEADLDILQPIQTTAKDMDTAYLKREYGKDICLWGGGCDTQVVLPRGAPEDVIRDVQERVDILSPGGGFVFQQVHNIMADIPPANIVAMFDTVNSNQ
jgi:uroporphyrinogen decarboxylase